MPFLGRVMLVLGCACIGALLEVPPADAGGEYTPIERPPVAIGPQARRLIVGFRASPTGAVAKATVRRGARGFSVIQAHTTALDAMGAAQRAGLALARSRQLTPSMHVLYLQRMLYGAEVGAALEKLKADPSVAFAAIDGRRYPLGASSGPPNDPLFSANPGTAAGQWYLGAPNPNAVVEGVATADLSAIDAIDAWALTTGSDGIVIADVDTGVRFDHPDLLRAGFGGRLLPGYDFVGQDYDSSGTALGTHLIANDGDGYDPDPSDPGDWIDSTDQKNSLFANDTAAPSSWHGTRVVGVYGALTNNQTGVAGVTWSSWILPVRALGKGGGYDSDIIAGIEWAVGLPVTNPDGSAVPANPYPADIVNLSLGGGSDACLVNDPVGGDYASELPKVTALGVLIVVAAGNASGAVSLPANCAATVPGVLAIGGLRNVGTMVGYSSRGPEVSISAPAGNCINTGLPCLRSIDTTTNFGASAPGANGYTDENHPNIGTSFATPIVSGIAALMRSVNNNLTPAQLAARLKASATAFPPNTGNVPVCPVPDSSTQECSCLNSGQCGSGMVNAYQAVLAAQRPIAAVALPAALAAGSNAVFDASGSAAACGRRIATYAWSASGAVSIISGSSAAKVTILPGTGTVTLTLTDDMGAVDVATVTVSPSSASTGAPASAGTEASACPVSIPAGALPPSVSQSFSPAQVRPGIPSTLTITFSNTNGFVLTQSDFTQTLPAGLSILASPAASTTCTGTGAALSASAGSVSLSGVNIPAHGSCSVTLSVSSSAIGTYTDTIAAQALMTAPAGGNSTSDSSVLTVSVPPASGGGGGGLGWLDLGAGAALAWALRRRSAKICS